MSLYRMSAYTRNWRKDKFKDGHEGLTMIREETMNAHTLTMPERVHMNKDC